MPIVIEDLMHIYDGGGAFPVAALNGVTLNIEDGELVGVIGHTGSGKSTLVQHLNALLKPTSGKIIVQGMDLTDKKANLRELRHRVGMVFQYPEHQLFEETIWKDIAFGPHNLGLPKEEIAERVAEAMELVGLDAELASRSPFELSGGQKRRAAIAGVLSMRPEVLVLDEPIAGLDPQGREEIISLIRNYRDKYHATVILVSHNMADIARICTRVLALNQGKVALYGTPAEVFAQADTLREIGLDVPQAVHISDALRKCGHDIPPCLTIEQLAQSIIRGRKC